MELALKIDLTEEQYQDLMTRSYHELFATSSFREELGKTICEGILEWFKSSEGSKIIKETFTGNGYWRNDMRDSTLGKKLVESATQDYIDKIKEPLSEFIYEVFRTCDLDGIVRAVIYNAIMKGLTYGAEDRFRELYDISMVNNGKIDEIKSKLQNIGFN